MGSPGKFSTPDRIRTCNPRFRRSCRCFRPLSDKTCYEERAWREKRVTVRCLMHSKVYEVCASFQAFSDTSLTFNDPYHFLASMSVTISFPLGSLATSIVPPSLSLLSRNQSDP